MTCAPLEYGGSILTSGLDATLLTAQVLAELESNIQMVQASSGRLRRCKSIEAMCQRWMEIQSHQLVKALRHAEGEENEDVGALLRTLSS